ncbi:hypothetical protein ABI59_00915 [Acidobacteria bacterium Mor1]|nr:hypothetical protein ABI59_00915 [Acidobacteria bacterium Mor1]
MPVLRTTLTRLVLLSLLLAATGGVASAQTAFVDDDNCPGPGSGTDLDPFCSIQDAICDLNGSGGGDVMVRPGTYNESLRMLPNVNVMSTDGPEVTIIDATGQPCTQGDCQPSPTNLTCSAVVFATGAEVTLDGFRITGGSGIFRDVGGGLQFVAGGGVFVFNSSPTITNNQIVANVLNNGATDNYFGGGVYVEGSGASSRAEPTITNNMIMDNIADPPDLASARAQGGGIYIGGNAAPLVEGNTIEANRAGDVAKVSQGSEGGGMVIYSNAATPTITRNVIRGNIVGEAGGGVKMGQFFDGGSYTPSRGLIENNLFEYNESGRDGGGAHTNTTTAAFRSNTFIENTADRYGAALHFDTTASAAYDAELSNSILTFNTAGIEGGGFATYYANPDVSFTDIFGNIGDPGRINAENIGGDSQPEEFIGNSGNVSINPGFVDRQNGVGRDLRLRESSRILDSGSNALASSLDLDGDARIQDGDGDTTATVDPGAYEHTFTNDWDADGDINDTDPDDDNDGTPDASDCAPFNTSVSQVAGPVGNTLDWFIENEFNNPTIFWSPGVEGRVFNVYRGTFGAGLFTRNEVCYDGPLLTMTTVDEDEPAPGTGFYYLVENSNICGTSRLGITSDGVEYGPIGAPCPSAMGVDTDGDGLVDLEDNCPAVANGEQLDRDFDFVGDACDSCPDDPDPSQIDRDSDGVDDVCDCNPDDQFANSPPTEVTGLQVNPFDDGMNPVVTRITYQNIGVAFRYDIASGDLADLQTDGGTINATCLATLNIVDFYDDVRPDPPVGEAYYYLVRGLNSCAIGTYGESTDMVERTTTDQCENAPIPDL